MQQFFIQLIGYVGMAASIYSFQKNDHKSIMALQMIANFSFAMQYLAMGALIGTILNLLSLSRAVVFFNHGKKWADFKGWIPIYVGIFIVFGILTCRTPVEVAPLFFKSSIESNKQLIESVLPVLPSIAMVLNTFSFASRKPRITRATILFSSPGWLIYSFLNGSWGGFLNECFVLVSTLIAMVRYDIPRGRKGASKSQENS